GRTYRCWIDGNQILAIIPKKLAVRLEHLNARNFDRRLVTNCGNENLSASRAEVDARIEALQQVLAHVEPFRQHLLDAGIANPFDLGHTAKVLRNLLYKALGQITPRYRISLHDRHGVGRERRPKFRVDLAVAALQT